MLLKERKEKKESILNRCGIFSHCCCRLDKIFACFREMRPRTSFLHSVANEEEYRIDVFWK